MRRGTLGGVFDHRPVLQDRTEPIGSAWGTTSEVWLEDEGSMCVRLVPLSDGAREGMTGFTTWVRFGAN